MQYRDNGHIFDDGTEFLSCDECGTTVSADDTLGKIERCSSAANRFVSDGLLVIDTDYGSSPIGVASTESEAIREAEDLSTVLLMEGDYGILD